MGEKVTKKNSPRVILSTLERAKVMTFPNRHTILLSIQKQAGSKELRTRATSDVTRQRAYEELRQERGQIRLPTLVGWRHSSSADQMMSEWSQTPFSLAA
jgi:hypothetical protein